MRSEFRAAFSPPGLYAEADLPRELVVPSLVLRRNDNALRLTLHEAERDWHRENATDPETCIMGPRFFLMWQDCCERNGAPLDGEGSALRCKAVVDYEAPADSIRFLGDREEACWRGFDRTKGRD